MVSESNEPMLSIPMDKSKITAAVWSLLDDQIVVGHENGELTQYQVKVSDDSS